MRYLLIILVSWCALAANTIPDSLASSVNLRASFDKGVDADVAKGDPKIYSAPDYKQQGSAKPGLGDTDVATEKGVGIGGTDALRFRSKNTRALFFKGDRHVALTAGTVSFWLKLDPQKDLAPGFCDPIQVTDKAYNDSAIWVDFTKDEVPRHFRLGVFGALTSWNPKNIPPDKNPDFMNRLIVLERPPFARENWTLVTVRWNALGSTSGSASLFVNGKMISTRQGIREPFEWDAARLAVRLGVNYVGLMDEVTTFNRALTDGEIAALYRAGSSK